MEMALVEVMRGIEIDVEGIVPRGGGVVIGDFGKRYCCRLLEKLSELWKKMSKGWKRFSTAITSNATEHQVL